MHFLSGKQSLLTFCEMGIQNMDVVIRVRVVILNIWLSDMHHLMISLKFELRGRTNSLDDLVVSFHLVGILIGSNVLWKLLDHVFGVIAKIF